MAIDELQSVRGGTPPVTARRKPARVRTIEHRKPGILAALSETWKFRRFTLYFGRRFLTKRYGRTWLGSSGSRSDPP